MSIRVESDRDNRRRSSRGHVVVTIRAGDLGTRGRIGRMGKTEEGRWEKSEGIGSHDDGRAKRVTTNNIWRTKERRRECRGGRRGERER